MKTIAAKAAKTFQQTEEYNTVLFSWNYKGINLFYQYLVKYPSRVDLENLDMEVIHKEKAANKAS